MSILLLGETFNSILNLSVPLLQEKLMSERNSIIAANNNRHARERAALERQQEKLQVGAGSVRSSL